MLNQYCQVVVVVVGGVDVAVENMCLVCSFISISIPAPCHTNQVGLGVPRKRCDQVLGEEAEEAARFYKKLMHDVIEYCIICLTNNLRTIRRLMT